MCVNSPREKEEQGSRLRIQQTQRPRAKTASDILCPKTAKWFGLTGAERETGTSDEVGQIHWSQTRKGPGEHRKGFWYVGTGGRYSVRPSRSLRRGMGPDPQTCEPANVAVTEQK